MKERYFECQSKGYMGQLFAAALANQNKLNEALGLYKRVYNLMRFDEEPNHLYDVYYNIGSSYLMSGNLEEARLFLERTVEIKDSCARIHIEEDLLLYQKYALLELESADVPSARVWIKRGLQTLEQVKTSEKEETDAVESIPLSLKASFLWLAYYLEDDDPKMNPAFLAQLEKAYQYARLDSHFGFQIMYGTYLVAVLSTQRRYKEALKISKEINVSWKTSFNAF